MVEQLKKLAEQLEGEQELPRIKLLISELLENMEKLGIDRILDQAPELFRVGIKVLGRFDPSQFKQEIERYVPMVFESFPIISKRESIRAVLSEIEETKLNINLPDLELNMHMIIAQDGLSGGLGALEEPDLALRAATSTFLRILAGELDPTSAYMMGELEVEGDLTRGPAILPIFEGIRKELGLE